MLLFAWMVSQHTAGRPDRVRTILRGVAVSGAITAMYGIAQYFGWDPLLPRGRLSHRRRNLDHRASAGNPGVRQLFRDVAAGSELSQHGALRDGNQCGVAPDRAGCSGAGGHRDAAHRNARRRPGARRRAPRCGSTAAAFASRGGWWLPPRCCWWPRARSIFRPPVEAAQPRALVHRRPVGRRAPGLVARQPAYGRRAARRRIRTGSFHRGLSALRVEGPGAGLSRFLVRIAAQHFSRRAGLRKGSLAWRSCAACASLGCGDPETMRPRGSREAWRRGSLRSSSRSSSCRRP